MNTNPSLGAGLAGVLANAVAAGIIASSRGSAIAAPAPLRNVRRGIAFLVMNTTRSFLIATRAKGAVTFPSSPRRGGCAINKELRSFLSSRRRGGVQPRQNSVEFDHHPVRSIKEAS